MAALDGKVKIPLVGEVGKKPALIGGALFAGFIGFMYVRHRNNAAATNASAAGGTAAASAGDTGLVTDPAGNQCAAVDSNSGYCPGSAEDSAYQSEQSGLYGDGYGGAGDYGGGVGYTGGSYGGQGLYVDPNGNTCVTPGPDGYCPIPTGTGTTTTGQTYATNEAWLTAAESAMHAPALADAAERIFAGLAVTANEKDLFLEAVGLIGPPPNGYPTIHLKDTKGQPATTGKVKVPDVVGQRRETAGTTIRAAGLTAEFHGTIPKGKEAIVTAQNPKSGESVNKGTSVSCTIAAR